MASESGTSLRHLAISPKEIDWKLYKTISITVILKDFSVDKNDVINTLALLDVYYFIQRLL